MRTTVSRAERRVTETVRRHLLGLLVTTTLLVGLSLVAVWQFVGPLTAIKGAYSLLGLFLASLIVWLVGVDVRHGHSPNIEPGRLIKLFSILLLVFFVLSYLSEYQRLLLIVAVPLFLGLLAGQLVAGVHSRTIAVQVAVLVGVLGLRKYLSTGLYFGRGDVFSHTQRVRGLLETGSFSALDLYKQLPVLHILTGLTDVVTGLQAYDALLLLGITTYVTVTLVVYLLTASLVGRDTPLTSCVVTGVVLASPIIYYTTYFHAQSLAVAFLVTFVFVLLRQRTIVTSQRQQLSVVGIVLISSLVYTHHLSFVIFAPILLLIVVWEIVRTRAIEPTAFNQFRSTLLVVLCVVVLYHLIANVSWFVTTVVSVVIAISSSVLGIFGPSSSSNSAFFYYHTMPDWAEGLTQGWSSLFSPTGLYFGLLLAVFVLGTVGFLLQRDHGRRESGFVLAGIAGSFLVFPTPLTLAVKSIARIRFVWMFVFVFVVGYGLRYVLVRVRGQLTTGVFVLLLVSAGTASALAAADDVRFSNVPADEHALSDEELQHVRLVSSFLSSYDRRTQTHALWVGQSSLGFTGFEIPNRPAAFEPQPDCPSIDAGLLLYRNRWTEHRVIDRSGGIYLNRFFVGQRWLRDAVGRETKVYDNGVSGLVWGSERRQFAPSASC